MLVAIHDDYVEPFVESGSGPRRIVHLPIDIDIKDFVESTTKLTQEEKQALLRLWFDESIQRDYSRREFGVLISEKEF